MDLAVPKTPSGQRAHSGERWGPLILLVVSICINYVDRANLSAAVEDLSRELALGPERAGALLSAFFWTYAAFQVPAGWLIDRRNVYRVYAVCYFVWSAATALTGFASSFSAIFGLRLILGAAESVAYPSYSKIIASTFDERQRGLTNALIDAGSKLGPYLGLLIGGKIIAQANWRVMFISIGLVSLIWLGPWLLAIRGGVAHRATITEAGPARNFQTARRVGHVYRPVVLELRLVFPADLAAFLLPPRTAIFRG